MSKLILVRHAAPATDPCVAASQWPLSEKGRAQCAPLAEALRSYLPASLYASREAKAAETAALVARALGTKFGPWPGLHEHARGSVEWLGEAEFRASVAALFARPGEVVFGDESADAARVRFAAAVTALLAEAPAGNVLVFTHGTVMALFVAHANQGIEAFEFWQRLRLPAVVVLDRETLRLETVIEEVGADAG